MILRNGELKRPLMLIIIFLTAAYVLKISRYFDVLPEYVSMLRNLLHISVFTIWGIYVKRRIAQPRVKSYLVCSAALMVFWMIVKAFKYFIFDDPIIARYLWYMYYLPMLFIPLLALMTAFIIGRSSDYVSPPAQKVLIAVTCALFLMVITNDLHQLVFTFPENGLQWDDSNYSHNIIYYLCAGWMLLCGITSLIVMIFRSKLTGSGKFCFVPAIPLLLAVLYTAVSLLDFKLIKILMNDMSVIYCILFMAILECCIWCRLIPSNMMYDKLFEASVNNSAYIVDNDYNICYSSRDSEPISGELMQKSYDSVTFTPDRKQIHNMKISGGHVIWIENHGDMVLLHSRLQDTHEELETRNALLKLQYEEEKASLTLSEQNSLYDLLHENVLRQLDMINMLVHRYSSYNEAESKQRTISKIVFVGTYIKRRKDLTLSAYTKKSLNISVLRAAIEESLNAIKRLGIHGSLFIYRENDFIPAQKLICAYDFFEAVAEASADNSKYLSVRISPVEGVLRMSIFTDCSGDFSLLYGEFPEMYVDRSEDGINVLLPLKGGA